MRRPYIACAFGVAAFGAATAVGAVGADRAVAPRDRHVVAVEAPRYPVVRTVRAALRGDWLRWPVAGGSVTGRFGEQRAGHRHQGIDIPRPVGTPIHAAAAGTVVMREWQDGYGNYTCIRHVHVLSCYAHQSRFHTRLGARVRQGEVIGFTGDTGTSEAPHLHFEVRRGRRPWTKPVNPLRYLPPKPGRVR